MGCLDVFGSAGSEELVSASRMDDEPAGPGFSCLLTGQNMALVPVLDCEATGSDVAVRGFAYLGWGRVVNEHSWCASHFRAVMKPPCGFVAASLFTAAL